ncbi:MAG: hypothetical protein AAF761_02820 [Pseudomonadota bacterium]
MSMADLTKIATCCYCGTRAVLNLRGVTYHELACRSCGAKLNHMKSLKTGAFSAPGVKKTRPVYEASGPKTPHRKKPKKPKYTSPAHAKKSRKKRKGWLADVFDELGDFVEDFFD